MAHDREYRKARKGEDPLFKLRHNIRVLIKNSVFRQGYTKNSRTHEILGCSYEGFVEYLHDNPYGFTIDQDGLDLDHITPVSSAGCETKLTLLNHYTNFQLLPSDYNRYIKKDNPWDQEDFENWYLSVPK
jgi:hypothetical protein